MRFTIIPAVSGALAVLAVAAASAQQAPPMPASTPGEALFVVSGRGWGHGVGMSQFGAYGMAKAGRTYDEILAHYYMGTTLGRGAGKVVRVLLTEGRKALAVSSEMPFTIVDAAGEKHALPVGPLVLGADLRLATAAGPVAAKPPLIVRPGKGGLLSLDGRAYRGKLEIARERGFLRVVNVVPLESYLEGVVAGEVPHTWPMAALQAQAVAARSYALATVVEGKPFDLYSDVRSQVYLGVAGEQPRTSEAVRFTARQVVLYEGEVATTYYFSTSGGRTASAADVFGTPIPYLVSRPDPWDRASPYHRWGPVLIGARTMQSKLGLESRVLDASGVPTPSGRVRSLVLETAAGRTTVPAALLRTGLGLRSTWVTIGVLRLDRPRTRVVFGSKVKLTGIVRGLPQPVLLSSAGGSAWSTVGDLASEPGGSISFVVKPSRSTRYRIGVEGATSPTLLVGVAPRVRLEQPVEPSALSGTVRPKLASVPVTIERREGQAWSAVAEATIDPSGAFRVELPLLRGSYRPRVPATAGLTEGVGPVLVVEP
ncbi:MAG TPA: SpoIID/LytB domain-containing protein [Gaiellaceae bacterium]|nr:SpoIID/LytB domain-containing protein [Gaiellaceae bacterium]